MAKRKRLLWQLYPSYLLLLLISLVAVAWYASRFLSDFYLEETIDSLAARALLVENRLLQNLDPLNSEEIDRLCKELGNPVSTRITVVLPSGQVIGDSHEDPQVMDNHADRPEIRLALAGQRGKSKRYSRTLDKNMLYVALPLMQGRNTVGVVRTAIAMTSIEAAMEAIRIKIAMAGVVIAILAAGLGLLVARRISRPLEEMRSGVEHFTAGDLSFRLSVPDSEELAMLAESMNQMALELDGWTKALIRQRNELEAVLSSMVEGVIAVDREESVLRINLAAAEMLGVSAPKAKGKSIQEVIRNSVLQDFVRDSLAGSGLVEKEIIIHDRGARILNGHGTSLKDEQGRRIGALLVLNDVTRLRKLEAVRRDFVANVSHELKTPITNIKGFVETLRDGALKDTEESERFLAIVEKHVDRLNAIIDDLLRLSRVEQDSQRQTIQFHIAQIRDIIISAVDACRAETEAKGIEIAISCSDGTVAKINPPLLEQAIVNLITNAVKYSEQGSEIRIEVLEGGTEITLSVEDNGCGIAKQHLPRVFERFYRVDKARSREMGGTGLGLAIVKHIAEAHGGHVSAKSSPGKGSRFDIHLPRR